MGLLFKPDWEEVKPRYRAWWAGEALDRCMLSILTPKPSYAKVPAPPAPDDPVVRWTDLDYIARANEHALSRSFFLGEAFPIWTGGYPGHTAIPSFLGCPTTLSMQTGWWDPVLTGDDWDIRSLKLDKGGRWWTFTIEMLKRAAQESRGKAIPSIGAFGGCGDTLAAVRGTDRLLYDVVECPERVLDAEMYLMDMWCEVYEEFYTIVHEASEGSTCWFDLWSPGRFYAAQCDFSYMISPATFQRLFLPAIEKQTRFLDHTVYHCDGVEAFRHIPALCELPRLHAIQVLPGAGKPTAVHYMDTLKTVQAAGKNLQIIIRPEEVKIALDNLSARGLCIRTGCRTEAEARQLLEDAKKWSHDRNIVVTT